MRFYTTAELAALSSDQGGSILQRSFTANLMRLQPNGAAPMFAMSGLAQHKRIMATAHSVWVKQALFPSVTVNGAINTTATTLVVDSTTNVVAGTIYMKFNFSAGTYAAPELLQVTAVTDATDLVVVRGFAGTIGTAISDNEVLIEVGNSNEEGSSMPVARSITMSEHTNFTQIFRNAWDMTETAAAVAVEPGISMIAENREDAMFLHAQDIEWSTIFGRKSASVYNGRPMRTMSGIEAIVTEYAPGNIASAGTTTTFDQLESMLHATLDTVIKGRSTGVKTLFCGSQAIETLNEIARATPNGRLQFTPESTQFGQQFHSFRTSRGMFEMVEHPLLNAHVATKKMAIVADLGTIDFQYLRDTAHKDVAYDGVDATSGVYTSELTVEMTNPTGWGIIHNLTAGA